MNRAGGGVKLWIQVSGVGVYDNRHIHKEESTHYDKGFLSRVIHDWEGELHKIENRDLRIVILRLGVVLDKNGGFLKQLLFPLKAGIGLGVRSEDYFPFIALDDLMNIFVFSVEKETIQRYSECYCSRFNKN